MIFSSYSFLLIFLPLSLLAYSIPLRFGRVAMAKWALAVASLLFYAIGSGEYFTLFVVSVLFNYVFGRALAAARIRRNAQASRVVLTLGVLANVVVLGFYKYTNFLIQNWNFVLSDNIPYRNIVLPIGISFYTFQLIAYLVDSYRGETHEYSLLDYLLFITFFPQLIVGPIVHHKDVVPQFGKLNPHIQSGDLVATGLFLFAIGCAKKVVLADPLSLWAQDAFDHVSGLTMLDSWAASISYTLSYYFDLSGYADMAIGIGLCFGIMLPTNFDSPYKARNFADYWRRWHITLSRFLGDYVFRNVYKDSGGAKSFYLAIMVTFLVSGLWHGAGWNFVAWGAINGLFVAAAHAFSRARLSLPGPMAWFLTFLGVVGVRVLFVSSSISDAMVAYARAFDIGSFVLSGNSYIGNKQPIYIAAGLCLVLFFPNSNQLRESFRPTWRTALLTASLLVLSLLHMSTVMKFLYFQF